MSGLQTHVAEYLRLRRALGFKLKEDERVLGQLVGYLEAAGAETVSSEPAIQWARLPVGVHPNHWAKRLRIARGFAGHLQTIDRRTEIPPADVFPYRRQRATPYLFSEQDIRRLLEEARRLRHPMRAASYEALFGLLVVSGMRIGEAIALEREDVDLDAGMITIRKAKHDRARLVPLHPTATQALRCYASERDRLCPTPRWRAFFLSSAGLPRARERPAPDVQGHHDPDRHPYPGGAPADPRDRWLRSHETRRSRGQALVRSGVGEGTNAIARAGRFADALAASRAASWLVQNPATHRQPRLAWPGAGPQRPLGRRPEPLDAREAATTAPMLP